MDLTLYVMERALQDLQAWQRAGLKAGVAVNVSALLPADPMFAKQVKTLLTHYAVAPDILTLEVTESIALSNQDAAIPALEGLAELGIVLSIDDYGTGQDRKRTRQNSSNYCANRMQSTDVPYNNTIYTKSNMQK